jgi:hypothetical protein
LYTEGKSAPFANEQDHAGEPIREIGDLAGVENGKSATQSAFDSAAE